jgi:hypothetical protein
MWKPMSALAVLVLGVSPAFSGDDTLLAQARQARYVILGYDRGESFLTEQSAIPLAADLLPEERRALETLREQIESGDRFIIANKPEQADLFIAIRIGRRVGLSGGFRPGQSSPGSAPTGTGFGLGASSSDDMIEVFDCRGRFPGTLLWRAMDEDGLQGSSPRLFDRFQEALESGS